MKQPKFQYVHQRYKNDCAIACLAMITGYDYLEVDKYFRNGDRGVKFSDAMSYLNYQGLGVIVKEWVGCHNIQDGNKLMGKSFADIHLVSVIQWADSGNIRHAVVMEKNGRVHDPGDILTTNLKRYYEIERVGGIFYE